MTSMILGAVLTTCLVFVGGIKITAAKYSRWHVPFFVFWTLTIWILSGVVFYFQNPGCQQ